MSSQWIKGWILTGSLLILTAPAWAQRGPGQGMQGFQNDGNCQAVLAALPKQDLSAEEIKGLTYLREEEKLARDIYATLFAKWGVPILKNIAQSEQRHMDALKVLLDRYGLDDPAANSAVGVFKEPALKGLFAGLVSQGQVSLAAAMRVGATIEDLDIHDLDLALKAVDNDDIKLVYGNLRKGSRNHMRAFVGQLKALGEIYEAQYIGKTELDEILASRGQGGMGYGARGNGRRGSGQGDGVCPLGNTSATSAGPGPRRPE